jgi:hypothetical protein
MIYLSAYLTKGYDHNREEQVEKAHFGYLEKYYRSIVGLSVKAIVALDEEQGDFVSRYRNDCVGFHLVEKALDWHPHDARFQYWLDLLTGSPEVEHVALTDVSDVTVNRDVRVLIEKSPGKLLIGVENEPVNGNEWMDVYLDWIYRDYGDLLELDRTVLGPELILNCGIICGQRQPVLTLLIEIVDFLRALYAQKFPPKPLDMFAVNYLVRQRHGEQLYQGQDLHTRFGHYQEDPSKYFQHK